jgi:pyruvate dehydrogenase E2 component (dihydrolipoamide acetyltransferase)
VEEIFVPALGMAMEQAILVEWLKEPGDPVAAGDDIALIETDKSTVELTATTSGHLGEHRFEAGANVPVGSTITEVLTAGEGPAGGGTTADPTPPLGALAADDGAVVAATEGSDPGAPAATSSPSETTGTADDTAAVDPAPSATTPDIRHPHRLSPRQRRLAAAGEAAEPDTPNGRPELTPNRTPQLAGSEDPARRAVARAVTASWTQIPHFAVMREIDGDGLLDRLAQEAEGGTGKVSVTDVLIHALAVTLEPHGTSHVGLAVATAQGVTIPVVPDAAHRTLAEISELRRAAVSRAHARRSTEDDALVPLVTLSNLGTHGVRWFTGIIPLGQRALLTTGSLEQRPVVRQGRLGVGWQMSAILNVDHRVWDGADGADLLGAFAQEIRAYADRPSSDSPPTGSPLTDSRAAGVRA